MSPHLKGVIQGAWALMRLEAQMSRLSRDGFMLETEEYGPPATGKTTRALALLARLKAEGKCARRLDDIPLRSGGSGVQVWVQP